ncbi:MAG: aromatic ring-hydroxylating dioxygenase subunit alpha [Alphaproteobacteria bacterium]|nr:aromatic ring-hydroxylating dioxygenase subunit alpha [Alphaproteobacteria bacterium]
MSGGNGARRYTGDFVDNDRGWISREIFTNQAIYEEELERVFARAWLFIGHESQIAAPGDFILSRMGDESVILNRDQSGRIHVFLNNCRHRGMRVCRYDQGNTRTFVCPYHAWSFSDEGKLVGVPKLESAYHNELDKSKWGLIEARVANYRGFIFACWDESQLPFEEYLGDLRYYFDEYCELPDGGDGPLEAFGGIFKWRMPCNWKFAAENFAGDYYHNPSHASVDAVVLSPSGEKGRHTYDPVTRARELYKLNICVTPEGHTARGELFKDDYDYVPTYQDMPVVEDYFREAFYKRRERIGERARFFGHGGTIFPNVSYSNGVQSMGTWHPIGPHETETWRIFLVPKEAPEEVKQVLRHYVIRYQGPSGLTEQDDMENWYYAHEGARGTIAKRHPFNYEMGMGHEQKSWPVEWLGGTIYATEDVSEQNQRAFYKRWATMMDQTA